ncbi:MAG: galactokinase [Sediminibacterium sp.]|nr:MAG: galactokinase [Sediminibacterium sp.]
MPTELSHCIETVRTVFVSNFGHPTLFVQSPGRINLIGEHTDYNQGFVLPAAIDKAIYLAIGKRADKEVHLIAADLDDSFSVALNNLNFSEKTWSNYLIGVVDQLQKNGYLLGGFNAVLAGDVPLGAGLSSSAAVECATVFALNELFELGLSKIEMVRLAQKAENEFVGVKCGIMDQFASMFGKTDAVIQLDCQSLGYNYMPFNQEGIKIVLLDTRVKHSLASTEYNLRREECDAGVKIIQEKYPAVVSLRNATMQMIQECLINTDQKIIDRCSFVVAEIKRLQDACKDLEAGDLKAFGKKMYETHDGLSKLYEVSCAELDFLADFAKTKAGVLGARMMGGGFGGCTINLVEENAVEAFVLAAGNAFQKAFGTEMKPYIVSIGNGTSLLDENVIF